MIILYIYLISQWLVVNLHDGCVKQHISTPLFIMTCETSVPGLEEAQRPVRMENLKIFQW